MKKVDEEKKEEKKDPMVEMMQRIRSGNVALKKVAPPPEPANNKGGVMAEMAKLLVRNTLDSKSHHSMQNVVCFFQASNRGKRRGPVDVPKKGPQSQENQMSSELFKMFKKRRNIGGEPLRDNRDDGDQ